MISDENDEIIIYDAMVLIRKNAKALKVLVDRCGTSSEKKAYSEGVYVPCIKLQLVLGADALDRGKKRHDKIAFEFADFLRGKHG